VKEKLVKRSYDLGEYFMSKLLTIESSHITQIRGRGLLIGMVLDTKARPYCEALARKRLLCKETHENVIRFAPPLVITRKEIDWACARIADAMRELH
jgi:ornithine--oxo-acid transaminase